MSDTFDVIVIGAGFAGSAAARELSLEGRSVLHLEARDRIGGRTWYKEFGTTRDKVEFGGTWVVPQYQSHIRAEIERYGHELVDSPTPQTFAYPLAGEVSHAAFPIPMDQWMDFERAIVHIDLNARRINFEAAPLDQAGLDDLDVPFEDFLDLIALPDHTREFLLAWASFYFGAEPAGVSALHILSWVAGFGDSSVGWFTGVSAKFAKGTGHAIAAITEESRADLRLSTVVTDITHDDDGVTVTTSTGDRFRADACVVATPINTWSDLKFEPKIEGAHGAIAIERQAGQSTKIWALVANHPENFYGVGYTTKIRWLATEYQVEGGNLMVGFGCDPAVLDVNNHQQIADAVKEFLPDADVVEVDAHAWNDDEFANGTWMAYRPGQVMAYASELQKPIGRLFFAGSDLASGWAGWMDGALESGKRAAADVAQAIGPVAG